MFNICASASIIDLMTSKLHLITSYDVYERFEHNLTEYREKIFLESKNDIGKKRLFLLNLTSLHDKIQKY